MLKKIYFEEVNQKDSLYLADHCINDPASLSEEGLRKFKKKTLHDYHWHNDKKMKTDYKFLNEFIKKKSKVIFKNLNRYHNLNKSDKFWKIIIYPWLTTITYILYDRWEIVNSIKNKKKFIFNTFNFDEKFLIPESFKDVRFVDNDFNLMIYSKIIDFIGLKCKKKKLSYKQQSPSNFNLKTFLQLKFFKFFSLFFKNDVIINNCGLTFYHNIILNLNLNQFPFLWINPKYKKNDIDLQKRKKFFKKKVRKKNFEDFFEASFYIFIPKSYLEDFKEINNALENSYWPKKCLKIFTAYEYKLNDIFKTWVSKMTNNGAKYYIIQHGGNFGSSQYEIEEDVQINVADKFLSWGWGEKNEKKILKFNAFPLNFIKSKKWSKLKNDILICIHFHSKFSYRISSLPKTNIDRLYKFLQIKNFALNLKDKNIVIRYPKKISKRFNYEMKENYFPNYVTFDHANRDLKKIIHKYKLVIHDNDSTTFLISMFYNIPTILILDAKIEKFRPNAKKFYKALNKNNILFYDPVRAAKFVNKIENSVENWWYSKNIQKIRKNFCSNFIKKSNRPIYELKNIL